MWKETITAQFKVIFRHLLGGTVKNQEIHQNSRNNQLLGQHLNPGPPEYDAGALIARPRSIKEEVKIYFHASLYALTAWCPLHVIANTI
jgi:hypothetical protein